MKDEIRIWCIMTFLGIMFFLSDAIHAEGYKDMPGNEIDTLTSPQRLIHRVGMEIRPGYIFPTNTFLDGENNKREPIRNAFSAHMRYSFKFHPDTYADRIYRGVYQGIGLAYYSFKNREELGNPITFYLFQGAQIATLAPFLSFNYEWNFGISAGWKPYDFGKNYYNKVIGSKVNAYLNAGFFLNWRVSPELDLTTGVALTHFSNGNTKFPNAGLNTVGLRLGFVYNFNREEKTFLPLSYRPSIPPFSRHFSYDLVVFGSWRRKGVVYGDKQIPSPHAYPVLGFNFAPMYNLGYRVRLGASLDGVYDGSANVYTDNFYIDEFIKPSLKKQLALGISGRAEYVMPYFSVGIGLGTNILHGGGDLKAFYQILALKIEVTRSSFIHIGYSLQDFHDPNYLMLGVGFRFNNKFPTFHR